MPYFSYRVMSHLFNFLDKSKVDFPFCERSISSIIHILYRNTTKITKVYLSIAKIVSRSKKFDLNRRIKQRHRIFDVK